MTIYLPRISKEDFEAFGELLKDEIAANFAEWSRQHSQRTEGMEAMGDLRCMRDEVRLRRPYRQVPQGRSPADGTG